MRRFSDSLDLVSVWDRFPVNYTHIHTDYQSTSTLDHFLVNERLLSVITDAGVMHLGDNLSRHSPILLKLAIEDIPMKKFVKGMTERRPAWYKAEQENKDQYTQDLSDHLAELVPPDSMLCSDPMCKEQTHSDERDSFVLDLMSSVIEVSHSAIPMVGGTKATPIDPQKSCHLEKSIPGWREEVEPFKKGAIFWHTVWESAGRPSRGGLKEFMTKSRNQYH